MFIIAEALIMSAYVNYGSKHQYSQFEIHITMTEIISEVYFIYYS